MKKWSWIGYALSDNNGGEEDDTRGVREIDFRSRASVVVCPERLMVFVPKMGSDSEQRDAMPAYNHYPARVSVFELSNETIAIDVDLSKNIRRAGRRKAVGGGIGFTDLWDRADAPDDLSDAVVLSRIDELGVTDAAKRLGVSRSTLYRLKKKLRDSIERERTDE